MRRLRVLFAGGGTGGHVYPALSVATELGGRVPRFEALFVGTRGGLEARVIPEAGFPIRFIFSRGMRGRGLLGKGLTMASLLVGFFQAMRIISGFKPDLVFGSGGYASAAVVLAASLLGCTIVLQEQNSIPGLTNRLLASRARRIYIGFERARAYLEGKAEIVHTGNPLRREIVGMEGADPFATFGLEKGAPVLLVFGGSQGAHRLNEAAVDYLLSRERVQAIIQTGDRDYRRIEERAAPLGARVHVAPYISNMNLAYRAASVALARAGALSVSELAAVGLPAVLVPYPFAADDHQRYNAELLADAGGAVVIDDGELDGERLGGAIDALLEGSGTRLAEMRLALERVGRRDAAAAICDDMISLVSGGKERGEPKERR